MTLSGLLAVAWEKSVCCGKEGGKHSETIVSLREISSPGVQSFTSLDSHLCGLDTSINKFSSFALDSLT